MYKINYMYLSSFKLLFFNAFAIKKNMFLHFYIRKSCSLEKYIGFDAP